MAGRARLITGGKQLMGPKVNAFQPNSHAGVRRAASGPLTTASELSVFGRASKIKKLSRKQRLRVVNEFTQCPICHASVFTVALPQHLIRRHPSKKTKASFSVHTTGNSLADASPRCPTCGSAMVRRATKKGQNVGSQFWACVKHPTCKGTRPNLRSKMQFRVNHEKRL